MCLNKIKKLKEMGEKYSKVTEYYDDLIYGVFIKMPVVAMKLVNQTGNEILQVLKEKNE